MNHIGDLVRHTGYVYVEVQESGAGTRLNIWTLTLKRWSDLTRFGIAKWVAWVLHLQVLTLIWIIKVAARVLLQRQIAIEEIEAQCFVLRPYIMWRSSDETRTQSIFERLDIWPLSQKISSLQRVVSNIVCVSYLDEGTLFALHSSLDQMVNGRMLLQLLLSRRRLLIIAGLEVRA